MGNLALPAYPRLYWLFAGSLVVLAASLRLHGLTELSRTVDESTIIEWAHSIVENGYPVVSAGTLRVQLATYELYAYILALFMFLFGNSDFALRMPSVLCGIGTTYLVYHAGCRWFGIRTGVIAGLLYAMAPWTIFWSQNAFHYQTHQFFGMLTIMQAVRILRDDPVQTRTYYLAAAFFCCGFLVWEGLGFLLPVLFIAALVVNWGDWKWLRNGHLWVACAIVCAIIVAQGTRRMLLLDNYLLIGQGRSEITGPETAFLEPHYLPYFYTDQMFGVYTQFVVSIVFGLGILLIRRHWHFRFLSAFVVAAVLVMANLLSFYTLQYVYFSVPAFILSVAAASVMFADYLGAQGHWLAPKVRQRAGAVVLAALAGLELATASVAGLKTYGITEAARNPPLTSYGARLGIEYTDYEALGAAIRAQHVPGDPVLTDTGYGLTQHTGLPQSMYMQHWTVQKVVFDPGGDRVYYVDKAGGGIVLRSQREFEDILARNDRRVWFVAQPNDAFASSLSPGAWRNFQLRTELKAESYIGALYLWNP